MTPTRIPTPDMTYLQKLAIVNVNDVETLDLFWSEGTRQVVINKRGKKAWYAMKDGNIIESLCSVEDQLMIFDQKMRHGKAYEAREIYDCEWSDFACEKQVLHFKARVPV